MLSYQQTKYRKKRILQVYDTKTVTVVRGKFGYGFTISGETPCMLSCIVPGSPAHMAGLKAGDLLYFVNGQNVTKACHDDVVRMVGLSTGSLELQVAENSYNSDSSDDDYLPQSKSRYHNRVRVHQCVRSRSTKLERIPLSCQIVQESSGERLAECELSSSLTSQEDGNWPHKVDDECSLGRTRNNRDQICDSEKHIREFVVSHDYNKHVMSTAKKIFPAAALVKKVPPVSSSIRNVRQAKSQESYQNIQPEIPLKHEDSQMQTGKENERNDKAGEVPVETETVRAIVGYIGSIEMPSSQKHHHQRLQSFRNTVRRLRMEKKVHSLVLMEVTASGVLLTNVLGKQVASYPSNRIVSSGICPDDRRYFGLITLSIPEDKHDSRTPEEETECWSTSKTSCHIFMTDPDMSSHCSHVHQAQAFQINCAVNPVTGQCRHFPESSTFLIHSISDLYRNNPSRKLNIDIVQSQAFLELTCLCSNSRSSTDSGFRCGKEEQNEQVCVVDLSYGKEQMVNSSILSFATNRSVASMQQHLPPDTEMLPSCSALSIRNGLSNLGCGEEYCQQNSQNPLEVKSDHLKLGADLENTENISHSFQHFVQPQQQHLHEYEHNTHGREHIQALTAIGVEQTTIKSISNEQQLPAEEPCTVPTKMAAHSIQRITGRSAFQLLRPVPVPLEKQNPPETVDLDTLHKLSPRALPHSSPSSCVMRSLSAPPAPFFPHRDSDDDDEDEEESEDDPYIHHIRSNKDKKTVDDERCSFSEEFPVDSDKLQEVVETGVATLQKWSRKIGSFKNADVALLKQSFGQSLESLTVSDVGVKVTKKLMTACSVSNITSHSQVCDAVTDTGRIAVWAVQFDKLLKDQLGITVFTEFLKREFSDENIRFWRECELFHNLTSDQQRKEKAKDIYTRFLSAEASDPVNVDSTARSYTEAFLDHPRTEMFDVAQNQIFHLMRQDSYVRFLKSDLYKNKLMEELEGRILNGHTDPEKVAERKFDKNQDAGKEADGNHRRRSMLPWKHLKDMSKKKSKNSDCNRHGAAATTVSHSMASMRKKTTGLGIDLSTMRKEVFNQQEVHNCSEFQTRFCRIIMPDGSTTVVCCRPGQTANSVLTKLCEKRSITINNMDIFLLGSDRTLDLTEDISNLGSKEIVIERRVLFHLELPSSKSVEVKAKPSHTIRDAIKPVIHKHGYTLSHSSVYLASSQELLDLEMPVLGLDNQRVVVITNLNTVVINKAVLSRSTQHLPVKQSDCLSGGNCLEEITNKIFEDLMHGKSQVAHGFHETVVQKLDIDKAHKNKDLHSLGFFALLRKQSQRKRAKKSKVNVPATSDNRKGSKTELV